MIDFDVVTGPTNPPRRPEHDQAPAALPRPAPAGEQQPAKKGSDRVSPPQPHFE